MYESYNKLVRDNIPEILIESGKTVSYKRVTNKTELVELFKQKLWEEHQELENVIIENDTNKIIEEAADVMEVVLGICKLFNIPVQDVYDKVATKKHEKGSFNKGYVLLEVRDENY